MNLWVIFLTGLTTGGLTCLAVQGGLLATALTQQKTVDVPVHKSSRRRKSHAAQPLTGVQIARNPVPVAAFLGAKLLIHTLLGAVLGALGSLAQITPTAQAIIQIAAALFMIANALNMLNVHPIFRYFVIQPPKAITRLIRNQSRSQDVFAPALLGLMTVFIPCGTTQMMAAFAATSGSPLTGAAIMFAFVLGTAPTFFVLGFLATQLSGKLQKAFAVATAALIIILAFVSLDGGLNLLGSPLAPSRVMAALLEPEPYAMPTTNTAKVVNGVQEITIRAYPDRYLPNVVRVASGQPIRIRLVTKENYGCTNSFVIPKLRVREFLDVTGEKVIDLPAQPAGAIFFSCGMGMYTGNIIVS